MFAQQAGINVVHAPFKGAAPALTAMLAGQTDLLFSGTSVVVPQIKVGKLRPMAVTSLKRVSILPELPTLIEAGLPVLRVKHH